MYVNCASDDTVMDCNISAPYRLETHSFTYHKGEKKLTILSLFCIRWGNSSGWQLWNPGQLVPSKSRDLTASGGRWVHVQCHLMFPLSAQSQLYLTHVFILFCLLVSSHHSTLWRTTIQLPRGSETRYRYFKGFILESKVRFSFPSKQTWYMT